MTLNVRIPQRARPHKDWWNRTDERVITRNKIPPRFREHIRAGYNIYSKNRGESFSTASLRNRIDVVKLSSDGYIIIFLFFFRFGCRVHYTLYTVAIHISLFVCLRDDTLPGKKKEKKKKDQKLKHSLNPFSVS